MFIYYQDNPLGKSVGDCSVRAISNTLDMSWEQTYIELCLQGFIMADIKEIEDKSMGGYSQRGYSYDDWNGGHSNRGVRYNRNSYGRGHRRDDREEILDRLDYLMENSGTEQERQAIRQALNTLENM